jgi:uncharacterized DUF497 family protein
MEDFEWDVEKATGNLDKHGISFEEGTSIFNDPLVATIFDPDHSESEDRYISIGMSVRRRLLVAVHTYREERIRLISCRLAANSERKIYENQ